MNDQGCRSGPYKPLITTNVGGSEPEDRGGVIGLSYSNGGATHIEYNKQLHVVGKQTSSTQGHYVPYFALKNAGGNDDIKSTSGRSTTTTSPALKKSANKIGLYLVIILNSGPFEFELTFVLF